MVIRLVIDQFKNKQQIALDAETTKRINRSVKEYMNEFHGRIAPEYNLHSILMTTTAQFETNQKKPHELKAFGMVFWGNDGNEFKIILSIFI
jgi:hypothetical protein